MSHNEPQVLLITADAALREQVRRNKPIDVGLRWTTSAELAKQPPGDIGELWVDLDDLGTSDLPSAERRVYFHSRDTAIPAGLPTGLFIRKPCADTVAEVLWAGVERPRREEPTLEPEPAQPPLPYWLLEFYELGLRELCRKCVLRLPARLGYADASLYLHEPEEGMLTLAETTHRRPIDLVLPLALDDRNLMAAVARTGRVLATEEIAAERRARGLPPTEHARHYADGRGLIAPLVSGGRLWGVLNLSGRQRTEDTDDAAPLEVVFRFLGRALRYARAYDRARTQARVDSLTGLFNRRWLTETLTRETRRAQRGGTPLTLIMIDLDGLKAVNDRKGHAAGDCLLRHIAGRISAALRQSDSAARVGGDEFVVLLPATNLEGAGAVAHRVLDSIRNEAALFHGAPLPIRASLGVAQWQPGWDAGQLMEAADQALYQAKQLGRDQIVCRPYEASAAVALPGEADRRGPAPPTSSAVAPPAETPAPPQVPAH